MYLRALSAFAAIVFGAMAALLVAATASAANWPTRPVKFIVTTQSIFVVLIFSFVVYVSVFDVKRWSRDNRDSHALAQPPPAAAAAKP